MTQTIYCDESGFTGAKLSDKAQPHFVYTSVAITPDRAAEIVQEGRRLSRTQLPEIKGQSLLKHTRGRKAISLILEACLEQSKLIVTNKQYALACKLFEYVFEPALSNKGSIFYHLGFNRFVSTLLFAELQTGDKSCKRLFDNFEDLLRLNNADAVAAFFGQKSSKRQTKSVAKEVMAFAHAQRQAILDELNSIGNLGVVGKWTLDVTDASLFPLLCFWGTKYNQLDVFCDDSKPLSAYINTEHSLFAKMVGRTNKQFVDMDGRGAAPVTFNLLRPITLARSDQTPGIQIADVISATIAYALENMDEPESREWVWMVHERSVMHDHSILPNLEEFPNERYVQLNKSLLKELVRRSRKNEDLLEKIEDFIRFPYRPRCRR